MNACRIIYTMDDDSVWYGVLAVSRPGRTVVKLADPLARALQKRFARHSMPVMLRA